MRAIQINSYGKPDVIEVISNAFKPVIKTGQVLIEVYAASINPFDAKLSLGYMKDNISLQFPLRLGGDLAGAVVEVGAGVEEFKIGDEVYGQANVLSGASGSMADFAAANSGQIALKPEKESMTEAAALPLVGVSAIQAIIETMNVQTGQKILIHGGAGGIGSTAIQLAKSLGAYVATTVGTRDIEFVKKLGADEVVDYKTQKFEEILKDYDGVFDTVGGEMQEKSFDVLKNGGVIVSMLGEPSQSKAKERNITSVGQHTMVTTERLQKLAGIVDSGKLKIQIDKVFPLDQAKDAFSYQEESHPRGKVVLSVKE